MNMSDTPNVWHELWRGPEGEAVRQYWWVAVIAVAGVVAYAYFATKCPTCNAHWKYRPTGGKERRGLGKNWAWLLGPTHMEYRCRKCGYTEWKEYHGE